MSKNSRTGHPPRRTTLLNPMGSESQPIAPESPPIYPSFDTMQYTAEDLAPPIEQFMEGELMLRSHTQTVPFVDAQADLAAFWP